MLAISTALICATLLIIRHVMGLHAREEIYEQLRDSVITFQNFQHQRETTLEHAAELLANLPSLKALMTTGDLATIQDASADLWRLGGSDLFVLADRAGRVAALHTASSGFTRNMARELLHRSLQANEPRDWWYGGGHLYEVFLQPIYFGPPANNSLFGVLAVGYEIDDRVATEVGRMASGQVAVRFGAAIVVSTLTPNQQAELARHGEPLARGPTVGAGEVQLGDERFLATSVELAPGAAPMVRLTVLKSYDQATVFLESLNRLLLGVGLAAILSGSVLVFLISHTFTRPLADLVAGVRALEKGDFTYPLEMRGDDEVAELSGAFDRMRRNLKKTQEQLLQSERLATIGRMASLISHDLRHPLTAILAYAEFLSEGDLEAAHRRDLYQEIRLAVNQMTDLIASLLEFSRAREALRPVYGSVDKTIQRAIQNLRTRPEFSQVTITFSQEGRSEVWFDPKKLERVFNNLLVNACEVVPPDSGRIEIRTRQIEEGLEIRVRDNGPGIPELIREKLFQAFVSCGKENGTGLGLAVVQKIVQDHGGSVSVESTGSQGTVFRLTLPLTVPAENVSNG